VKASIRIDTVTNPPRAVVLVRGEIDASTSPQLTAAVEGLPAGTTSVELDLAEMTFIDSTGLSAVAMLIDRLEPVGGKVILRSPSSQVIRLLTITDLLRFVDIVDRRDRGRTDRDGASHDVQVTGQTGDFEQPLHRRARRLQDQPHTSLGQSGMSRDQDPEARRVDEAHSAQFDRDVVMAP
jgi:anti-anti-sigma factor